METSKISLTLVHSAGQLIAGVTTGSLIDAVFPEPLEANNTSTLLETAAEVIVQVAADALVSAAVIRMLMNLDLDKQDPTNAFGFTIGLIDSQPNLRTKIQTLSTALRSLILGDIAWATDTATGGAKKNVVHGQGYVSNTRGNARDTLRLGMTQ